jgi:hypothetical protein
LSFSTLRTLRNIESKLVTAIAIIETTMETISSLYDIAAMVQYSASVSGELGLDRSADDLALAQLKLKSRAYVASAKVLKTRVKVLIEMVSYYVFCFCPCIDIS